MISASGVYLITDRLQAKGNDLIEAVRQALKGGIKLVQLREKDLDGRELLKLARELRGITRDFGAKLLVNGRLDIAVLCEADGIHIGQSGIPPGEAVKMAGSGFLIGVSTHSLEEALKAQQGNASFITFGPVFETPSKLAYGRPVGLDALRAVKENIKIPVFAIGGIRQHNATDALNAGADGIAVISAVIASNDPESSARALINAAGRRNN